MNNLLQPLLEDQDIKSLIAESRLLILSRQIHDEQLPVESLEKIVRIAFLLMNHCFAAPQTNKEYLEITYTLLRLIEIEKKEQCDSFDAVFGVNGVETELLYYFYLSAITLQSDQTVSIRLDLRNYSEHSLKRQPIIWQERVLNILLNTFILLVRKNNGFSDIRIAIGLIETLRNEQKEFEDNYLGGFDQGWKTSIALSLLGLYHLSKALIETATYLIQGYSYKKRIDAEIRQHTDVAGKLLSGEPRLQSLVLIMEHCLYAIWNNSIWKKTSFNDKVKKLCELKANSEIIELLPAQRYAIDQKLLDVAANVIVLQMPTSSGKSLLAEFNILVTKALRSDARIIYIVPSRALVNQVYHDLKDDLEEVGLSVEKTSTAIEVDPNEDSFLKSEKIDILVSTPEKLDLLVKRKHPAVNDVSLFVVDEAHFIQNGERGAKLELLLTLLRRERPDAKYMLLSPFIKNAGNTMADWLGGGHSIAIAWKPAEKLVVGLKCRTKRNINEVIYEILPSPYSTIKESKPAIFQNPYTLKSTSTKDQILEFASRHFTQQGKTQLVLCRGKKSADTRAKFIFENLPAKEISDEVSLIRKFILDEVGCETVLTEVLKKGVCTHHAGLSDETKLLIEYLVRKRYISHVCGTSTLAEGVNFPVSSVFFDDYRRGDLPLTPNDFWNIAGRAGRTLVDNFGTIILPFNDNKNEHTGRQLIRDSANELVSVLSELFVNADEILTQINNDDLKPLFQRFSKSISPLIQYFVHLISVGGHETYVSDIEDLFKDSFEYFLLKDSENQDKFILVCKNIYLYLQKKYGGQKGMLSFSDKTGFSVPSVLKVMQEKATNSSVADLDGWMAENVYNPHDYTNLTEKIKVVAALPETELGTKEKYPFNPEIIAKILTHWVKGSNFNELSQLHPYYRIMDTGNRINEFITKMADIRVKSSWGLSALEGIVKGNEKEIKDSYIPSFAYFGVDNEKALALRMVGVPRMLSRTLAKMLDKDVSFYTSRGIRSRLLEFSNSDWDSFVPTSSKLNGLEWKHITEILIK